MSNFKKPVTVFYELYAPFVEGVFVTLAAAGLPRLTQSMDAVGTAVYINVNRYTFDNYNARRLVLSESGGGWQWRE